MNSTYIGPLRSVNLTYIGRFGSEGFRGEKPPLLLLMRLVCFRQLLTDQVMSYSLNSINSIKGGYTGIIYGTTIGFIKGDTRSLDSGSHRSHASSSQ